MRLPTWLPGSAARPGLAALLAAALLGCGPIVMLPGGALDGQVQPAPDDWSFTDEYDVVQLETRPSDPYSVNVWGVAAGGAFYVAAGNAGNQWASHIEADPDVRLKVGDTLYELRAVAADDEAELETFLLAAERKYDFEPEPEQREKARLFRLEPR